VPPAITDTWSLPTKKSSNWPKASWHWPPHLNPFSENDENNENKAKAPAKKLEGV